VYEKARENFLALRSSGRMFQDEKECYYIWRLTMDGRAQTGIVACASVEDYLAGAIKKHELTRADKEADRIRHLDALGAHVGPIFLAHRPNAAISAIAKEWTEKSGPDFSFVAGDGTKHEGWTVADDGAIARIAKCFEDIGALYIADGHHRCASAARVAEMRRAANPGHTGGEEYNYFLSVAFPADELCIFDYNRVVKDLNGLSEAEFLEKIRASFDVEKAGGAVKPASKREFGLLLKNGGWHRLRAKPGAWNDSDPVEKLDVSILQNLLLAPVLGIDDPRTNKRIDFVGGIRGLAELEKRVAGDMAAAFSMYPTSMEELMFEPKLRSGLFVHTLG
jgi:uncharacterized protein (DUF1015 family)